MTAALELPAHMSYSQLGAYLRCGEQYRLERLVRAPQAPAWALVGGSAVHTATEEWDRALLEGNVLDDHAGLWAKHFVMQVEDTAARSDVPKDQWRASGRKSKDWPDKETEAWWNHHGPEFVANWAAWRLNSPWEVWVAPDGTPAIEINFTVVVGGVAVKGAIDRIMATPDGAILPVDLKSGGEPDDTLQLGTYAKAMRDHFGVEPVYGTYWMARTGGTTNLHPLAKFTDAYLDLMYGGARKGMEAGIFLPKVTRMCSGCSVRDSCFAYGGENSAEFSPLPAA